MELDPKLKICVLSADRNNIVTTIKCLKNLGFSDISHTESGIAAIQNILREPVDYVLCDQNLKFISGWLFIKELKTSDQLPNIPVTLFGCDDAPDSEDVLKQYGVLKYIKFPLMSSSDMEFAIHSTLSLFNTAGTVENKYTKAKSALLNEETESAVELYSELRNLTEKSSRSSLGLAQAYVQDNNMAKATELIEEIAENGEDVPASMLLSAKVKLENMLPDEARDIVERLLKKHDSIFYYSEAANLFSTFKEYTYSDNLCQDAIARDFQVADFHICLAKSQYTQGNFDDCLDLLLEAEEKFGVSHDLLNLKGVCLKRVGAYSDAIANYEQALKLDPMNAKVYFNMAICYIEMSQFDVAISNLKTCIELAPNFDRAKEKLNELQSI